VASLKDDTVADKAFRFAIGCVLGAGGAWLLAIHLSIVETSAFVRLLLAGSLITGALSVVLGNAFIEGFLRGRWWS